MTKIKTPWLFYTRSVNKPSQKWYKTFNFWEGRVTRRSSVIVLYVWVYGFTSFWTCKCTPLIFSSFVHGIHVCVSAHWFIFTLYPFKKGSPSPKSGRKENKTLHSDDMYCYNVFSVEILDYIGIFFENFWNSENPTPEY